MSKGQTAWVTVFNLFNHLNDYQLIPKLFQLISMVPSKLVVFKSSTLWVLRTKNLKRLVHIVVSM